jgi:hypothetical protein
MHDRRVEPRLLCAELMDIRWKDKTGRSRRVVGNLEDISASGACLQLETAIPLHMKVTLMHPTGDLMGVVRYCVFKDIGYFVGVQFDDDVKWNPKEFRPQHLLDPRKLVSRSAHRVMTRLGGKDESTMTH